MTKASATIDVDALKVAGEGATNYITTIDNGGIKVHDVGDENNYIQLTPSGMGIYQNNDVTASFLSDGIKLYSDGILAAEIKSGGVITRPVYKTLPKIINNGRYEYTTSDTITTGETITVDFNVYDAGSGIGSHNVTFLSGTNATKTTAFDSYHSISIQYTYSNSQHKFIMTASGWNTGDDWEEWGSIGYTTNTFSSTFSFGTRRTGWTTGAMSSTLGLGLLAKNDYETVIGKYNSGNLSNTLFQIGYGTDGSPNTVFYVKTNGDVDTSGNVYANGFKLNNKDLVSYNRAIVTDGTWYYQQYATGIIEMWYSGTISSTFTTSNFGAYRGSSQVISFPSLGQTEILFLTADGILPNTGFVALGVRSTSSVTIWPYNRTQVTTAQNVPIYIHAVMR